MNKVSLEKYLVCQVTYYGIKSWLAESKPEEK